MLLYAACQLVAFSSRILILHMSYTVGHNINTVLPRLERRDLEENLWVLEQRYSMIIKSAENHEIRAADLRGRAAVIMNIIEDIRRNLDQ